MINRKALYLSILIVVGIVFAVLLTFIIYKIWKYLGIKKQIETSTVDTFPFTQLVYPYNVPDTYPNHTPGYCVVSGQEPLCTDQPVGKPQRSQSVDLEKEGVIASTSKVDHTKLVCPPTVKTINEELLCTKRKGSRHNIRPHRVQPTQNDLQEQNKRVINLGRGSSLTEAMFRNPVNEPPLKEAFRSGSICGDLQPEELTRQVGKIRFTTKYIELEEKLEVHIIKAFDIAPTRDMMQIHPFVRVCLHPGRKQKKDTKCKKEATKEPFFNEVIIFQGLEPQNLDNFKLCLRVCNRPLVKKREILGEAELCLSSIDGNGEKEFTLALYKVKSVVSNALLILSVSYEFTAWKLVVTVLEVQLPKSRRMTLTPNSYVTLQLYHNQSLIGTRQTRRKSKTLDVPFNQCFEFKLALSSPEELKTCCLDATLCYNNTVGKDKNIGHVLLSSTSPLDSARKQWNALIEEPGVATTHHHSLAPHEI